MPKTVQSHKGQFDFFQIRRKKKEERKQTNGNFQAMMAREKYEEINAFLQENNITKVQLVIEGYEAMKAKLGK